MDDYLRRLERLAASGDYTSREQWKAALERAGLPDPDEEALKAPLTEWEEAQAHYDDLWWHASTPHKCGLWNHSCLRHRDEDFAPSVFKAHHEWGHRCGGENSKRQTLRTHRDGSRKNYRLRDEAPDEETEQSTEEPHERRRKKRFGGKEHRKRKYDFHPVTGWFYAWWEITKPDLGD